MTGIVERIRRHLRNPDSQHRQIAVGFIWVSLFVFIGKLAGAAKEMTIAWRYGISATVDAYVFIFNLVNWPVSIWASILTVVLLPLAARIRHNTPEELPRFRAELFGLTIILGLGFGLLTWLALPIMLHTGWLGLSGHALTEALNMNSGMTLLVPIGAVISLFSAWLLAAGKHRNTLFEAIPSFTLLVALLLPASWLPEPLLWGTVAGFALHAAALAIPIHRNKELPAPRFAQQSPAWQYFWGSIGIMALGQTLTTFTNLIDQFFAANLGEGALSTLSYANRIMALLLGLGATAISRATLPVFSEAFVKGVANINALAWHWARLMFACGLIIVLLGWLTAPLLVKFLFERGAFTADDTQIVSSLFRYMLPQVPFYFSALVFVSAIASKKQHRFIALSGATNMLWKLPAAFLLVPILGLKGLVLSTAIMYGFSAVLLYFLLKKS